MYRAANIPEGLARLEGRYREVRRVCLTLLEAIPPSWGPVDATTALLATRFNRRTLAYPPYRIESCNRREKYVKRDR